MKSIIRSIIFALLVIIVAGCMHKTPEVTRHVVAQWRFVDPSTAIVRLEVWHDYDPTTRTTYPMQPDVVRFNGHYRLVNNGNQNYEIQRVGERKHDDPVFYRGHSRVNVSRQSFVREEGAVGWVDGCGIIRIIDGTGNPKVTGDTFQVFLEPDPDGCVVQ